MRRLALLPLLALAACAPQSATTVENPVGLTEAELVGRLGVPTRSYEVEGRRFLAWDTQGSSGPAVVPSLGLGFGRFGGGGFSGSGFGTGLGLSFGGGGGYAPCTSTYELQQGRVVGFNQQGAGCG
jgi:hypothetical protein